SRPSCERFCLGSEDAGHDACGASEGKLCGSKKREQRAAGVNILKPLARLESRSAPGDDEIFAEGRAGLDAHTCVGADGMADGRLEKQKFERLGALKAKEVYVGKGTELRSDVEVGAGVGKEDAGIDEFGLAFVLAGTEVGDEAPGRSEQHAGAG